MTNRTKFSACVMVTLLAAGTTVQAASIQVQTSFDVNTLIANNIPSGNDNQDLDGSRITLTAIFEDAVYSDPRADNNVRALATSASAMVDRETGQDVTVNITDDVALFAGAFARGLFVSDPGSLFGLADGTGFEIGDLIEGAKLDSQGSNATGVTGNVLTFADVQNIAFASGAGTVSTFSGFDTNYTTSNFVTTVTDLDAMAPVPLPAGLPLLLAGLGGLGFLGRKRRLR